MRSRVWTVDMPGGSNGWSQLHKGFRKAKALQKFESLPLLLLPSKSSNEKTEERQPDHLPPLLRSSSTPLPRLKSAPSSLNEKTEERQPDHLPPLLRSSSTPLPRLKSAPSSLPLHLLHRGHLPPHLRSCQMDVEKGPHFDAEDPARTQCERVIPGVQPFCPQMDAEEQALQLRLQVWTPSQQPSPSQFNGTWPSGTCIPVDVRTLSQHPFPCEASIPSELLQVSLSPRPCDLVRFCSCDVNIFLAYGRSSIAHVSGNDGSILEDEDDDLIECEGLERAISDDDLILNWVKHLTDLGVFNLLVGAMDTKLLEALYWKDLRRGARAEVVRSESGLAAEQKSRSSVGMIKARGSPDLSPDLPNPCSGGEADLRGKKLTVEDAWRRGGSYEVGSLRARGGSR
ncbi:hypothetical protein MRB53_017453 [Persea americana]|uniref:Uncharacterized protein n=1 Tax=Persea americana TaxID=3435 RepID=A0ACC2M570_PERAE|nr:hypothetical protein MRB53_017453 [Persea americana]